MSFPKYGPFIVHAEIWPGVIGPDPISHAILDARQMLALVSWAEQLDRQGQLAAEFLPPNGLDDDQISACVQEQGWTLGATNLPPRQLQPPHRRRTHTQT
jgi:hypothetical protein